MGEHKPPRWGGERHCHSEITGGLSHDGDAQRLRGVVEEEVSGLSSRKAKVISVDREDPAERPGGGLGQGDGQGALE